MTGEHRHPRGTPPTRPLVAALVPLTITAVFLGATVPASILATLAGGVLGPAAVLLWALRCGGRK